MNNYALLFIASVFSFSGFAQRNDRVPTNAKTGNGLVYSNSSNNDLAIVSYHVEERINMKVGSNITTYDVSSLSLVSTNDLGPNNTRVITPKYRKVNEKVVNNEQPKIPVYVITAVESVNVDTVVLEEKIKSISIDIVSIYERILDKGYQSMDMLKIVGDSRFFKGDLVIASKWYSQLFSLTTDLDAIYYYRYARSLASVNQIEKSNEMMKLFESKNSEN